MKELLEKMAERIRAGGKRDWPAGIRFCRKGDFWRVRHLSGKAEVCATLFDVEQYLKAQLS